jgi:hypothetical protein
MTSGWRPELSDHMEDPVYNSKFINGEQMYLQQGLQNFFEKPETCLEGHSSCLKVENIYVGSLLQSPENKQT